MNNTVEDSTGQFLDSSDGTKGCHTNMLRKIYRMAAVRDLVGNITLLLGITTGFAFGVSALSVVLAKLGSEPYGSVLLLAILSVPAILIAGFVATMECQVFDGTNEVRGFNQLWIMFASVAIVILFAPVIAAVVFLCLLAKRLKPLREILRQIQAAFDEKPRTTDDKPQQLPQLQAH